GGIDNPFAMFYVFQIAIGSILLSTARAILVGISAMALFGGMVVLESSAWLPGHPLMFGTEDASGSPGAHGLLVLIALCLTIAGSIYFLQFVVRKQRRSEALRREHERVAVSRERLARIGEISAGIAHNIRNPLHGTLNCLDLLRAGPLGQEARETLDLMEEALRRMERVTNRLLVLTRDSPLRLALVDASEEIRDALRLAAARIGDKRIQLREELTEDAELLLDPDRFHEALVNILDNAIDACAEKGSGTITVRTHATTEPIEGVCIEIRDSGMGVAEDRIGRVFDPFFTTKAIGEGSGLGLAIARRVVERHGGRIDFESLPGRGTIVRLHLPLPGVIHGESRT
ncbi:MAG: sensor histidine kinase, partial [Planctomycetota bacterium]